MFKASPTQVARKMCGEKMMKAIAYSLELIVSVVNKSQRISLA